MKFIKPNIKHCILFEKILGYQYEIGQKISPIYNKKYEQHGGTSDFTDKDLAKNAVFNLCLYNIEYMFEARESLANNDLHVFSSTIRHIYESIPKMFYMLHEYEDIFYIICNEDYNLKKSQIEYSYFMKRDPIKSKDILKEFLEESKKYPLANGHCMDADYVGDKFKKFTAQYYRDQIYSNEGLKINNYFYAKLSSNAHPNTLRSVDITNNDANNTEHMKILTDLSFLGLYIQINTCCEILVELNEMENAYEFLKNINECVKDHFLITNMYPKNPRYCDNLVIELAESNNNG